MYGRPTEGRFDTICHKNLLWENQRVNLPFRGVLVATATCRGRLEEISPRRVVVVAVWSLLSRVEGKEKASRRHAVGANTFCSSLFGDLILSCRKCLPAGGPKCGGP